MNRLETLRNKMYEEGYDIVIIPNSDYHQSEYSSEYFGVVEYFSGFTGSNATLVVSSEDAVLYTDGRYFIQAKNEIASYGFRLMKEGDSDTPDIFEYIKSLLFDDAVIAFDGRVVSAGFGLKLQDMIPENVSIVCNFDPAETLWEERPALSKNPVWLLDVKYAGKSCQEKLEEIRAVMKEKNVTAHILASLDDIAWILNIRGNDVAYTPVVMAYLVIEESVAILYSDTEKYSDEVRTYLEECGVSLREYDDFFEELDNFNNESIMMDKGAINYRIYSMIAESNSCVYAKNPSSDMKAVKNQVELSNIRSAHIKDGLAVTRFILWLKDNVGKIPMTEWSLKEKLLEFRKENEGFIEESFEAICAYKANAALMHYNCTKENCAEVVAEGMLLVDSGGQYYEGTTDVTRTICLGEISDEEKEMFTLVLKGMIDLMDAKFIYGCTGVNLDILARRALWEKNIDYKCGTGHGVSYLLGVHEGPNNIRWKRRSDDCVIKEGMVTSNEPGVYMEGRYGIRTENEMVCVKDCTNEYGTFLRFENLTFVPIDLQIIDKNFLSAIDIKKILNYNDTVYKILMSDLDDRERLLYERYFSSI